MKKAENDLQKRVSIRALEESRSPTSGEPAQTRKEKGKKSSESQRKASSNFEEQTDYYLRPTTSHSQSSSGPRSSGRYSGSHQADLPALPEDARAVPEVPQSFLSSALYSPLKKGPSSNAGESTGSISVAADSAVESATKVVGALTTTISAMQARTQRLNSIINDVPKSGIPQDILRELSASNSALVETTKTLIDAQKEQFETIKETVTKTEAVIHENDKRLATIAVLADSINRNINNAPPSREEWEVVGIDALVMPMAKLADEDKNKGVYLKSDFYATALSSGKNFPHLFRSNQLMTVSRVDGNLLEDYLLNDTKTADEITAFLETNIVAIWKDKGGKSRLRSDTKISSASLYGVDSKYPLSDKLHKNVTENATKISLAVGLVLLSITRGEFRNAGLLLALNPNAIGLSLLEKAGPGFIYPVEVVFWMLHGLCKRSMEAKAKYKLQEKESPKPKTYSNALEHINDEEKLAAIKLVKHLFAFPDKKERSWFRSHLSGMDTSLSRAGMGFAVHHQENYFLDICGILLRPAASTGSAEETVNAYAFMLAVINKAVYSFIDELASMDKETATKAEAGINLLLSALGLSMNIAANAVPGGKIGFDIMNSVKDVVPTVVNSLKNVTKDKEKAKGKTIDKSGQIAALKDKVGNLFELHLDLSSDGANKVLNFIIKGKAEDTEKVKKDFAGNLRDTYKRELKILDELEQL